jgi:bifunctional DNase/RNase
VTVARPLTHDLLRSVIDTLGATIDYIVVNDLKNDNFFAKIALRLDGKEIEVDSRPSDALALAVRVEVPIYVDESVMDKAGILLDKETGKPIGEGDETEGKKLTEEELKKLSPFKDFIDTIDWDDFDKRKS